MEMLLTRPDNWHQQRRKNPSIIGFQKITDFFVNQLHGVTPINSNKDLLQDQVRMNTHIQKEDPELPVTTVMALDIIQKTVLQVDQTVVQLDDMHRSSQKSPNWTPDYARENTQKVVGRLNRPTSVQYWKEKIKASPRVIDWLENGVPLFPRGLLALAACKTPKQYSMSEEQEVWLGQELNRVVSEDAVRKIGEGLLRPD